MFSLLCENKKELISLNLFETERDRGWKEANYHFPFLWAEAEVVFPKAAACHHIDSRRFQRRHGRTRRSQFSVSLWITLLSFFIHVLDSFSFPLISIFWFSLCEILSFFGAEKGGCSQEAISPIQVLGSSRLCPCSSSQ